MPPVLTPVLFAARPEKMVEARYAMKPNHKNAAAACAS
jgi:hypothetical protein